MEVSAVGFGCMGRFYAYGVALEKQEAIRHIREAAENGYTLFDTAEIYLGKKTERMKENARASEVVLTPREIQAVDTALGTMDMEVFGQL